MPSLIIIHDQPLAFYDLSLIVQMARTSNITTSVRNTLSTQCVTLNLWLILTDGIERIFLFTLGPNRVHLWRWSKGFVIQNSDFFAFCSRNLHTYFNLFEWDQSVESLFFVFIPGWFYLKPFWKYKNIFRSFESNFMLSFLFLLFPLILIGFCFSLFRNDHRRIILVFRHCFHCAHRFVYYARVCALCTYMRIMASFVRFLCARDEYFPIRWISMLLMVVFYRISVHTSNPVYVTYMCNFE